MTNGPISYILTELTLLVSKTGFFEDTEVEAAVELYGVPIIELEVITANRVEAYMLLNGVKINLWLHHNYFEMTYEYDDCIFYIYDSIKDKLQISNLFVNLISE